MKKKTAECSESALFLRINTQRGKTPPGPTEDTNGLDGSDQGLPQTVFRFCQKPVRCVQVPKNTACKRETVTALSASFSGILPTQKHLPLDLRQSELPAVGIGY